MTQILRGCPYSDQASHLSVGGETILVRPHQIIVGVSVTPPDILEWDDRTPRIPAILDTGHSHNFSIQEDQLARWAGISAESLPVLGAIRSIGSHAQLCGVSLWIHCNRTGRRDVFSGNPAWLEVRQGIAVYPAGTSFPRLPLLGLRTISANRIVVTIDGEKRQLSARTRTWRFW